MSNNITAFVLNICSLKSAYEGEHVIIKWDPVSKNNKKPPKIPLSPQNENRFK
jgi:hypothetical protein